MGGPGSLGCPRTQRSNLRYCSFGVRLERDRWIHNYLNIGEEVTGRPHDLMFGQDTWGTLVAAFQELPELAPLEVVALLTYRLHRLRPLPYDWDTTRVITLLMLGMLMRIELGLDWATPADAVQLLLGIEAETGTIGPDHSAAYVDWEGWVYEQALQQGLAPAY